MTVNIDIPDHWTDPTLRLRHSEHEMTSLGLSLFAGGPSGATLPRFVVEAGASMTSRADDLGRIGSQRTDEADLVSATLSSQSSIRQRFVSCEQVPGFLRVDDKQMATLCRSFDILLWTTATSVS